MVWQAEAVRSVIFTPEMSLSATKIWTALIDGEPDSFQKGQAGAGSSIATGRHGTYQLMIGVQPGRVELGVSAVDDNPNEPRPLPNIPDVSAAAAAVKALTAKAIPLYPVIRVAVHLQLVEEVSSADEGRKKVNELIGNDFYEEGDTDILVQRNKRSPLRVVKDGQINHLRRWGVTSQQAVVVSAQGTSRPVAARHVFFMHVDINNVSLTAPVDAATAKKVADELWKEGVALIEGGSA